MNFIKVLEDELVSEIREELTNGIINEITEDFVSKFKPIVEQKVKELEINNFKCIKDLVTLRDELHFYVNWSNNE